MSQQRLINGLFQLQINSLWVRNGDAQAVVDAWFSQFDETTKALVAFAKTGANFDSKLQERLRSLSVNLWLQGYVRYQIVQFVELFFKNEIDRQRFVFSIKSIMAEPTYFVSVEEIEAVLDSLGL